MLLRILASSRYFTLVAIAGTFLGSSALVLYEAAVIGASLADIWRAGDVSPKAVKLFAVGMIEAVDVFLIAIALYIISLGLYALFVDDRLPLPRDRDDPLAAELAQMGFADLRADGLPTGPLPV